MPESPLEDYKIRFQESLFAAYGGLMATRLPDLIINLDAEIAIHDWNSPLNLNELVGWMTHFQGNIPADFRLRRKIIEAAEDSSRYEVELSHGILDAISMHPDIKVPVYASELIRFTTPQARLIVGRLRSETEYNLERLQAKLRPGYQQILGVVGDIIRRKKPGALN